MENMEYQVLIESMGPRENVVEHPGNVLDILLPIRGHGSCTSAPENGRTKRTSGPKSRIGWTKWRDNTHISIQSWSATLRITSAS